MQSPAKVNLRLKIEGLRTDGYHLLSMLNATIALSDRIEMEILPGEGVDLSVEGDNLNLLPNEIEKNLVSRAAMLFLTEFSITTRLSFRVQKNIPIGAGLGGGSSNAATVLKFLTKMYGPDLCGKIGSDSFQVRLEKMALKLGADVPFFLKSGLSRVFGVGEVVECLIPRVREALSGYPCCLLIPRVMVSTPKVYERTRQQASLEKSQDSLLRHLKFAEQKSDLIEQLLSLIHNDLMAATFQLFPAMGGILEDLNKVPGYKVSMSGSGSSFFAIPIWGQNYQKGDVYKDFGNIITRHDLLVFDTNFLFL